MTSTKTIYAVPGCSVVHQTIDPVDMNKTPMIMIEENVGLNDYAVSFYNSTTIELRLPKSYEGNHGEGYVKFKMVPFP